MTVSDVKWIEIDRSALKANLASAIELAGAARLMAVVKADAYGHGAPEVSRLALAAGASCLGVLNVSEARVLREAGIHGTIVLLSPPLPEEAEGAVRAGVEATVDSLGLAKALDRAAARLGRTVRVHADLDYGLGRWGIAPRSLPDFLKGLAGLRRVRLAGLSAHIDYVPGKNAVDAEEKLRDFHKRSLRARETFFPRAAPGSRPEAEGAAGALEGRSAAAPGPLCHAANTSVLLEFPHWRMDMVRLGNLLYGINPTRKDISLQDPWRMYARIIALRRVNKGRSIGYAGETVAHKSMVVATLPVGYSDGLTMEPAERLIGLGSGFQYWGMLRGRKTPLVGRCAISHVLVDVSRVPDVRVGDAVALPVRRTAASARIPRIYIR